MNPDNDQDGYYDFSTYCTWVITVHPENRIQYQFLFLSLESLEMKITDSYVSCEGDYLKVSSLYMEFLSSIVFHTVLFIPFNILENCRNVDAPLYRGTIYGVSIIDRIPHCPIYPLQYLCILSKCGCTDYIEVLYMEFLSSIVFHTDLFIPCNIYVFCQNVDASRI